MDKVIVKASKDKDTKNCYRYNIDENDKGVAGIVYIKKSNFGDTKPPQSIHVKVFEPKKNTDEKGASKKNAKGKK
jgi:hypothetical protein